MNKVPSNKEGLITSAVHYAPSQTRKLLDRVQDRIKENVKLKEHHKTPTEANLIMTCLKNHFVFYNLTEGELENIRDKMFWCEVPEGDVVFE